MAQQRRNGHANGTQRANGKRGTNGHLDRRRVDLTEDETRILVEACRMFRHSLPVYLMSIKPDLQLIDRVLRKLS